MQENEQPMQRGSKKKSDGFINLKVIFTDGSGTEHSIKAPMFGLDKTNPLHAALIDNPLLAEHVTVSIDSIRAAAQPVKAEDINFDFDGSEE